MARESLEDFLSFMSEKPRTWDWDAIVAYDRNTTNDLLMQEYIERFKSDAYFETLTFAVPITQGWQISEGQRLDKPRLKFEAADLGDSTADLSMRIVGGGQFHVGLDLNGGYRFNSIKLADALNGPVLHVRLRLGKTPGHIEPVYKGEAKVVIDLSNPTWDFYLPFSDLSDLMAVEQIIVEGGNDSQTIDVLLPLQTETHWFQYQPMADGSVQLELWTDGMDGALRIEPECADWFLAKGNGTLDLGLYTPAADGSDSYAVVVAFEPGNPRGYWWTYAILPMPYLDVAPIIENGARS
ncbi:hypothetical protein [Pseudomonas sp. WHRI 8519]|uniref:hypothetical protein n=1 Tax=Pseudomonas sp. WHRI 8519 TaxID=3162567 RepID=UPI0032EFB792